MLVRCCPHASVRGKTDALDYELLADTVRTSFSRISLRTCGGMEGSVPLHAGCSRARTNDTPVFCILVVILIACVGGKSWGNRSTRQESSPQQNYLRGTSRDREVLSSSKLVKFVCDVQMILRKRKFRAIALFPGHRLRDDISE